MPWLKMFVSVSLSKYYQPQTCVFSGWSRKHKSGDPRMLKMTHLANIVTRPRPVKELSAVFDIVAWLTCFLRDCNMAQHQPMPSAERKKKENKVCLSRLCSNMCSVYDCFVSLSVSTCTSFSNIPAVIEFVAFLCNEALQKSVFLVAERSETSAGRSKRWISVSYHSNELPELLLPAHLCLKM